ncbi:MAG TPA: glycosyltransferase family 39 protein [Anaerolineae bacterium]|nr:glycosyltransferase family 39 protein [Anaerolineae bacterium]HUW95955.1 glycosyltransferase family 39 protein [Anaerolineae bacterium]
MHLLDSPPGISGDAARLGLYAVDFLRHGLWPFYVHHQFGPYPLIIYLQAPAFAVFGFNLYVLRGVTALAGALGAPAAYLATSEITAGQGSRFARRAGVIAALGLALSPFFTQLCRYGIEGALLPVIELLCVASLWRGVRLGRPMYFLGAGLLLGLSQYVYIGAHAFPVALAVACLVALVADRRFVRAWRGLALTVIAATVVALPQLSLFVRMPYTFLARTQQTAGRLVFDLPDPIITLLSKLMNQLLMLGWRWDNAYNPYSSRPLLNPVLLVGFAVAVAGTVRSSTSGRRHVLALALVMLVPDLITYEGLAPSATRVFGAVPFIFVLAGMGLAAVWRRLDEQPGFPAAAGCLVLAVVLLAGVESQWDLAYRVMPRAQAGSGLEWRASLVEIAEAGYVRQHLDDPILLPTSEYQRAPLAFLLAEDFPNRVGGVPVPLDSGQRVMVIRPVQPERPTTEGLPSGYLADTWVLLDKGVIWFLPPIPDSVSPVGAPEFLLAKNGALAAEVYPARWKGSQPQAEDLSVAFQNGLKLVGYHATPFAPGGVVTVTLYWRAERQITADAEMFVQVLDRHSNFIAGVHDWPLRGAYRVRAWGPGETIPLSYNLAIPSDAPPGPYRIVAGAFDLLRRTRIALSGGGDYATVGTVKIPLPPSDSVPAHRLHADFGEVIELSGYTLGSSVEGAVHVELFWRAKAMPGTDYTVFVHVVDENGNIVAQSDSAPLNGQYPTSIWSPGESIVEERTIAAPGGEYRVFVGLYRLDTLERVRVVLDGEPLQDARVPLGTVHLH